MIAVVCVGIENQGNLGAIARVMANFGVSDLVLVKPQCEIGKEALDRASHAKQILKKVRIADSLDVLNEFDYVIGTTSKIGTDYNIPRTPVAPENLSSMADFSKRIAIMFGKESHGLSNKDLSFCDFVTTIPTDAEYAAMNLSHSCAVILYELSKQSLSPEKKIGLSSPAISRAEKDQILVMVDDILDTMTFATPRKKKTQKLVWKRILGKAFLTKRESFALMGFLKKCKGER